MLVRKKNSSDYIYMPYRVNIGRIETFQRSIPLLNNTEYQAKDTSRQSRYIQLNEFANSSPPIVTTGENIICTHLPAFTSFLISVVITRMRS
jgi:hypothetical protein